MAPSASTQNRLQNENLLALNRPQNETFWRPRFARGSIPSAQVSLVKRLQAVRMGLRLPSAKVVVPPPHMPHERHPLTEVEALRGKGRVLMVACGAHSTVVVTQGADDAASKFGDSSALQGADAASGVSGQDPTARGDGWVRVWTFGRNSRGQLGQGSLAVSGWEPRVAAVLRGPVRTLACGSAHTVLQDGRGQLYGWGDNSNGQLGEGKTSHRVSPVACGLIPPLPSAQVATPSTLSAVTGVDASIACGSSSTLLLDQVSGEVVCLGQGAEGESVRVLQGVQAIAAGRDFGVLVFRC